MISRILLLLLTAIAILSCNSKEQKIDAIIQQYNNEDFSAFKNISIAYKSKAEDDKAVYILQRFATSSPAYLVSFNFNKKTVANVDRSALQKAGVEDYLSVSQLHAIVIKFINYRFALLRMDSGGNVYINPFEANAKPLLLRAANADTPALTKDSVNYKLYKNNWYIRQPL